MQEAIGWLKGTPIIQEVIGRDRFASCFHAQLKTVLTEACIEGLEKEVDGLKESLEAKWQEHGK